MDMPKPSSGHTKLAQLAGSWEGEETMHPSPWDPKGGTAKGRSKSRLDLGGFALISDYEQERHGAVTFSGHSVWTFDPESDSYTLHWFDCMGTPPEVFKGGFQGEKLTMTHGGPGMHARLSYDFAGAQEYKMTMEVSQDGRAWNTMFEARYRKA